MRVRYKKIQKAAVRACYVPPILDTRYWGYSYMKYSYEYKRMRVKLYRQGKWPETPGACSWALISLARALQADQPEKIRNAAL